MIRQDYKECFSDIPVSRELIEKTKHLMKQKRDAVHRNTIYIKYVFTAAFLALVIFCIAFFPKIGRMISNNRPSKLAGQQSGGQSVDANINAVIHINQLGDMMKEAPGQGGPAINRIEKLTFNQYCNLLGFNPLPEAIPEGLKLIKNDTENIYFQNDRRVDFYNTWKFIYSSGSGENSKSITINVNPSAVPYWSVPRACRLQGTVQPSDVESLLKIGVKSEINGTSVTIWHKDKGIVWDYMGGGIGGHTIEVTDYYCADFKYKGAGFTVTAQNGITRNEFVQVIGSIIR